MRPVVIAVVVALSVLAGCGEDDSPTLDQPLSYTRGGGLAGRVDRLRVEPDGRATLTTRRGSTSFELTRAEMADLERDLRDFDDAPEDSRSDPPIPDVIAHTVQFGGRTVSADDEAMPEEVGPLMHGLGALVDAHAAP